MSIDVTGPDGSTVSFPDGTDHATIQSVMMQHFGPKGPDHDTSLGSAAKAVGTGAASGVVGLPGDLESLGHRAIGWYEGRDAAPNLLPTGSDVDKYLGYDPQTATTTERYLHSGAQMAAGSAIPLPGSTLASVGRNAALGAVGGLAGQAAGDATEGTAAEPYARVAASVLTPMLASRTATMAANAAARRGATAAPTVEDLKAAGAAGNDAFRASGATVDPNALAKHAQDQRFNLEQQGFNPIDHPAAFGTLNRMANEANSGRPISAPTMSGWMQDMRRQADQTQDFRPTPGAAAAMDNRNAFEKFLDQQGQTNPNLQAALGTRAEGNANWAAYVRAKKLQDIIDVAHLNADATGSGMNLGNLLRQGGKAMLRPGAPSLDPAVEDAVRQGVAGTPLSNLVRYASNALGGGGGVVHGMAATAGYMHGGALGAATAAAPGMALRALSNRMVLNNFRRAQDTIARNSPIGGGQIPQMADPGAGGVTGAALRTLLAMSQGNGGQAQ